MARSRQQGAGIAIILVVLVLVMLAFLATYTLSRVGASSSDRSESQATLEAAAEALERFAATALRLPCPANPAVDDGVEVPSINGTCTYPAGTMPWRTIGMKRQDAFDAWGWKISYRVYTGAAGSLTQARGVSMLECDTDDSPNPRPTQPVTGTVGSEGGLCPLVAVTSRSTSPAAFLAGKGLTVDDLGTVRTDVAFVLVSHGISGRGAYTASGVRIAMPQGGGDELANTAATGPFVLRAFSDADVTTSSSTYFDDLLVYRRLPDLVRRANLAARDWPEAIGSSLVFDQATVEQAMGTAVTPGDLGVNTLDFGAATVSGFSGGVAANLSYDEFGGHGGIGVGAATLMSNASGEWLQFDFVERAAGFAVTLNHFETYDFFGAFRERASFRFFLGGVALGSPLVATACRSDIAAGGPVLASFTLTPPGLFDGVEIRAADPDGPFLWISSFLVSEVKTCVTADASCKTQLAVDEPASECPFP